MLGITNKVKIPLDKPLSRVVIPVKQNDKNSRRISFTLTQNGTVYDIENVRVAAVRGTKPDGKQIYNDCLIIDNEIIYEITSQTISAEGRVTCELVLFGSDLSEIASAAFVIEVYPYMFDDTVFESSNEYKILGYCIEECTAAAARAVESAEKSEAAASFVEGSVEQITERIEELVAGAVESRISGLTESVDKIKTDVSELQLENRAIYGTLEYSGSTLNLITSYKGEYYSIPYKCYGYTDKDIVIDSNASFLINGQYACIPNTILPITIYAGSTVEINVKELYEEPYAEITNTSIRNKWGASIDYEVTRLKDELGDVNTLLDIINGEVI